MATIETVSESTRRFGGNSYLEVARRRMRDERGNASEFLVITRGFLDDKAEKRWTRFVTVPDDPETIAWLAAQLGEARHARAQSVP